ncbi:3'-5' exonuclease-like isoform X2 [Ziziphus jujuba]|uniref:3'-5' exonuclease n=1 Tax=Ziziphus jujuba TaxID=326968 RepID=A0A6P3ZYN9_ZIZJJ|nr:3'-5' exonuclease-like isoform X2 [Ziziphus jujuba]XP_060671506.1 3'-5' exonuclease-like isoform X2 [Ziziphus jujuba]
MDNQHHHRNHTNSVTTFSFISDWDDEPFTDEDLQAIEAALQSASKRPQPSSSHNYDDNDDHNSGGADPPTDGGGGGGGGGGRRRRCPVPFSLSPCQANLRMRYPVMKFGGQITYSRTAVEVEAAAMELLNTVGAKNRDVGEAAVRFDIEWRPTFKKGFSPGKAAVLQICGNTSHCHVMHIIHSGIPQSLSLLLENSTLLKVGVGIGNDAVKVYKDYNVAVKAVKDLSYLAKRKLGESQRWGLGSLTETLISNQLPKPNIIRLGNWEADVLSRKQLRVCCQ